MADAAQWISGARLRTLPLALAPVLIGTGAAIGSLGGFTAFILDDISGSGDHVSLPQILLRGFLALLVALCLQIGSNYANDYSDGIRGTDDERVGPVRLTATGLAEAHTVKRAAFLFFGLAGLAGIVPALISQPWWFLTVGAAAVAAAWFYTGGNRPYGETGLAEVFVFGCVGLAGIVLVLISQAWWFLIVGAAAVAAAWFYTGGKRPYGYMGLGEVFVFVFFGLVATLGTLWMQVGHLSLSGLAGAMAIGWLASAVLMVNNLRDIPTDTEAGKITLAVRLGDNAA